MTNKQQLSDKEIQERMIRIRAASVAQLKYLISNFGPDWGNVIVEMYVRTIVNEFLNRDDADLQKHFKKIKDEVKKALEIAREQIKNNNKPKEKVIKDSNDDNASTKGTGKPEPQL